MRGDYDSEANAISIDLLVVDHWDSGDLNLLDEAARRFGLDALGLHATTHAALAAPDHIVTVEVDPSKQPGSEAPF